MDTLKGRRIQISMTQSGDPLENAVAERANGILKTEWLYRMDIPDGKKCKAEVQRIIGFYNDERPHMSVGYQPPRRGAQPERVTEKMLEKSMGESSGLKKSAYLCAAKREVTLDCPPVIFFPCAIFYAYSRY